MRRTPVIFSALTIFALSCAAFLPDKIAINPSPSAPKGLYWIEGSGPVEIGNLVIVPVPENWKNFVVERGYLSPDTPLIKQIVAMNGDTICCENRHIFINGDLLATALKTDRLGRNMPSWRGCRTLADDEFLALMPARNSLDGRYFGPMKINRIIGIAKPIWTRKQPVNDWNFDSLDRD